MTAPRNAEKPLILRAFREFSVKEKGRFYPLQQKGYKLLYVFIPASPPRLDAGGRLRYDAAGGKGHFFIG
jgi:hypothetical protein